MSRLETVRLELGELEAMRLCDLERLEQDEAGGRMGVSRGTVQRLLKSGRAKLLRAIIDSAALLIEKGEHDEDLRPDGERSGPGCEGLRPLRKRPLPCPRGHGHRTGRDDGEQGPSSPTG